MLTELGLENVLKDYSRYPELKEEEIRDLRPEIIFLSSEPYPFKEKHIHEIQQALPDAIIRLVDGQLFSWYGSRLLHAPAYFHRLRQELAGTRIA